VRGPLLQPRRGGRRPDRVRVAAAPGEHMRGGSRAVRGGREPQRGAGASGPQGPDHQASLRVMECISIELALSCASRVRGRG
jgi:hypothetical protein